jgi:hypothetical protein
MNTSLIQIVGPSLILHVPFGVWHSHSPTQTTSHFPSHPTLYALHSQTHVPHALPHVIEEAFNSKLETFLNGTWGLSLILHVGLSSPNRFTPWSMDSTLYPHSFQVLTPFLLVNGIKAHGNGNISHKSMHFLF